MNATNIIYEIFRACRLCGAGGGYKMPIIQNFIPFEGPGVELREKIRECVQIEVQEDDKMPPLICELCVDKVNDFYEFMEMCQRTNKRTRLRLGLPPQTTPQGAQEDCILGVTETVFANDEGKTSVQRSRPCPKSKKNIIIVKKEEVKVNTPKIPKVKEVPGNAVSNRLAAGLAKLKTETKSNSETPRTRRNREAPVYVDSRSSSASRRSSPAPARETRKTTSIDKTETPRVSRGRRDSIASNNSARDTRKSAKDDHIFLGKVIQQEQKNQEQKQATKPTLKRRRDTKKVDSSSSDSEDEMLSNSLPKHGRSKETPKAEIPRKKIKLTIKLPPPPKAPTPKANQCAVCGYVASAPQGLYSHMRRHPVVHTAPELACDPCGKWYSTSEEAEAHHRKHTSYKCRHCKRQFKQITGYYEHFGKTCRPFEAVPDVQCQRCRAFFPTATLMKNHKCPGASRLGGDCKTCSKRYATPQSLKKHEKSCALKSKESKPAKVEPQKPARVEPLKPARVEPLKLAKKDVFKTATSKVAKTSKGENSKTAKREVSKMAAVRRISRKLSGRLLPAAVRVAKCDPLLKERRGRGGRYNVANVPHDYGLDSMCNYPYKYSGVRVKSEPLCFNGMVSINKDIQAKLYREEDYVHLDSDLSSDSENEIEEFGQKLRKVPTLIALSLKTIFSRRCLGKVPRKLRKVKSDKLFDSLFNATADDDVACNINSIIDNLSKEDSGSVSLPNFGVNSDSDSVLDKSILGCGDGFDALMHDVNKNNKDVDVTQINDTNDVGNKLAYNDGDETDASTNDTQNNVNEADMTSGARSKENLNNNSESDKTETDLSSRNGDTQDEVYNSAANNDMEKGSIENNSKEEINDETANETQEKEYRVENDCENAKNLEINNKYEEGSNQNTKANNVRDENSEHNRENEEACAKIGDFSNGVSEKIVNFDSEMDDSKFMDELNAQIGESEMDDMESRQMDACSNFSIDSLIDKPMPQSFGLGSIGDEEFL